MNRRQRKKNRVGEFTEYGFEIEATMVGPLFDEVIWNEFVPFIEEFHLRLTGGVNSVNNVNEVFGFITGVKRRNEDPYRLYPDTHERCTCCTSVMRSESSRRLVSRSCAEDDRALVERWFRNHPKIKSVMVGPLVDAWR